MGPKLRWSTGIILSSPNLRTITCIATGRVTTSVLTCGWARRTSAQAPRRPASCTGRCSPRPTPSTPLRHSSTLPPILALSEYLWTYKTIEYPSMFYCFYVFFLPAHTAHYNDLHDKSVSFQVQGAVFVNGHTYIGKG